MPFENGNFQYWSKPISNVVTASPCVKQHTCTTLWRHGRSRWPSSKLWTNICVATSANAAPPGQGGRRQYEAIIFAAFRFPYITAIFLHLFAFAWALIKASWRYLTLPVILTNNNGHLLSSCFIIYYSVLRIYPEKSRASIICRVTLCFAIKKIKRYELFRVMTK